MITRWAVVAVLGLAGCGVAGASPAMMGDDSSYHAPRLTCAVPTPTPTPTSGATVSVMLGDRGMTRMMGGTAPLGAHMMLRATPVAVRAGSVTFVALNMGWRTHELVIAPLGAGQSAGAREPGRDGTVDEAGSLGEASKSCGSGAGDGIASGAAGWVTVTLARGRYELFCNLENHYADGMYQELTVQ